MNNTIKKITSQESTIKSRVYFFSKKKMTGEQCREKLPQAIAETLHISVKKAKEIADKAVFSRKAGCSCGCSPGYILPVKGHNIYVDVK